ncbi:MAG: flagellar assembly protein FliW [Bryobacteraceae bacterium]|jgi:flagellar assembly factor FliW
MVTSPTPSPHSCQTRYFGPVPYDQESILVFPDGIPAFECEKRFLILRQPINEPLVFLQSLDTPGLCFVTLPVLAAAPEFRLRLSPEDGEALGLPSGCPPVIGRDILCLAILSLQEDSPPTVNLLAPIVVNLRTLRARQAIQLESGYTLRESLPWREAACS